MESLADGLNVIFGTDPTGQKDLFEFVRSMLFGFEGKSRVAGGMTIDGRLGRQWVQRECDDREQERTVVRHADGSTAGPQNLQSLLGSVRPTVFERVFAPGFGPCDLGKLIDGAIAHGFDLAGQRTDSSRLGEIDARLVRLRQDLGFLPRVEDSRESLEIRQRRLRDELQTLLAARTSQREQFEEQVARVAAEIAELTDQLTDLESDFATINATIAQRESEHARRLREFETTTLKHQHRDEEQRRRLAEIDGQIERWRRVLADLESQRHQLQQRADGPASIAGVRHAGQANPRQSLRSLESRLGELQKAVGALNGSACQCQSLKAALQPAIQTMREDVYRLCNHFSGWESGRRFEQASTELQQIERCEQEFRVTLHSLTAQRDAVIAELAAAGSLHPLAVRVEHEHLCQCAAHPETAEADEHALAVIAEIERDALAELAAEIERLHQRRDEIHDEIHGVRDELLRLRERQRRLAGELDSREPHDGLVARQNELRQIEQAIQDAAHRDGLLVQIAELEDEQQRLQSQVRESRILREAAELLGGFSGGGWNGMELTASQRIRLQTDRGLWTDYESLRRDEQGLVYLSLALAIAAAYRREGVRLPLLVHEAAFAWSLRQTDAALRTLHDFAGAGHQVFFFTGQPHVIDWCRSWHVPVHQLPTAQPIAPPVVQAPPVAAPLDVNLRLHEIADEDAKPVADPLAHLWSAEEFPGELTDRVRTISSRRPELAVAALSAASIALVEDDWSENFFLHESCPVHEAPSIDSASAERLRKIGAITVGDLLRLSPEDAAVRLRYAGISADMIRRWQAEALLVCRVPRLRPYDARILVACGIHHPEALDRIEADALRQRVEDFARTDTGKVLLRSGDRHELERLADWIHSMKSSRRHGGERHAATASAHESSAEPRRSPRGPRREFSRETSRATASAAARIADHDTDKAVVLKMHSADSNPNADSDWTFYLNAADPVERAPSIGATTAERLTSIGVVTVSDLIGGNAAEIASQLANRRITADTIRAWQQQALLVCRVPELRGHDAQMLVACGITSPEQLAAANASDLWSRIGPLVHSNEGKRIIRNGKAPDPAEVTEWIRWSQHARSLKAA